MNGTKTGSSGRTRINGSAVKAPPQLIFCYPYGEVLYTKTMTCKQLGGPCDKEFHAETFDELVEMSQKHGMEMAEKNDAEHINVMEKMRESMKDSEAMKEWMEKVQREFDTLPEDK